MDVMTFWNQPNLITPEIGVAEKSLDFHTVYVDLT